MPDAEKGAASSRRDKSSDVWHVMEVDSTLEQLNTSKKGLSTTKAQELQKQFGANKLTEKDKKTLRK